MQLSKNFVLNEMEKSSTGIRLGIKTKLVVEKLKPY